MSPLSRNRTPRYNIAHVERSGVPVPVFSSPSHIRTAAGRTPFAPRRRTESRAGPRESSAGASEGVVYTPEFINRRRAMPPGRTERRLTAAAAAADSVAIVTVKPTTHAPTSLITSINTAGECTNRKLCIQNIGAATGVHGVG